MQLSEWESKGYARAIALCTKSQTPIAYPTLDQHTLTDEQDFIRGFNLGMNDFRSGLGVLTMANYAEESTKKNL